jgi:hypothetical protein
MFSIYKSAMKGSGRSINHEHHVLKGSGRYIDHEQHFLKGSGRFIYHEHHFLEQSSPSRLGFKTERTKTVSSITQMLPSWKIFCGCANWSSSIDLNMLKMKMFCGNQL